MVKLPPLSDEIEKYALAGHVQELDENGLTVIPQEKLGLDDGFFDSLRDAILNVAGKRTGARFTLEKGTDAQFEGLPGQNGQFFLTHLIYEDPVFEKVLTHPIKKALMRHMLGDLHRLSVSNAWVKWKTPDSWEHAMTTAMHADQGQVPAPWQPLKPHVGNMNWLLTDYSKEEGAFSYVPGSHLKGRNPSQNEAVLGAVAVEAPMGSLVMFQGGLWHGSFRKNTPGLRVSMHGLHCRPYYMPQQDFKGRIPQEIFDKSPDPDYLRILFREDEIWMSPKVNESFPVPKIRSTSKQNG